MTIDNPLSLWDYRRRVTEQYQQARTADAGETSWQQWRSDRDELLSTHAQSPIDPDRRAAGSGLPFFPYDPAWRIEVALIPIDPVPMSAGHSASGATSLIRFASARFTDPHGQETLVLSLFWIDVYGGGVFLPFRDETNGAATYGGGRYLLDTIKGADLGSNDDRVVLDFNFAYHPSCVHSDRWSCPLAPPENRLAVEVSAGERLT
jgi:uncharacterized protein (DUF1684 family)